MLLSVLSNVKVNERKLGLCKVRLLLGGYAESQLQSDIFVKFATFTQFLQCFTVFKLKFIITS